MKMKKEKEDILTTPNGLPPADSYNDKNILRENMSQDTNFREETIPSKNDRESV